MLQLSDNQGVRKTNQFWYFVINVGHQALHSYSRGLKYWFSTLCVLHYSIIIFNLFSVVLGLFREINLWIPRNVHLFLTVKTQFHKISNKWFPMHLVIGPVHISDKLSVLSFFIIILDMNYLPEKKNSLQTCTCTVVCLQSR